MNECGAKTRNGGKCRKPAMENGRCRLHGGLSLSGADHPNFKHGAYSIYYEAMPDNIKAKTEAFEQSDPFDLTTELALSKALLANFLERFKVSPLDMNAIGFMSTLIGDISRLVEKISKIKNETALTAAEVQYLQIRAVDVALKYFPNDPQKQAQFITDLFGVDPDSSNGYPELVEGKASQRNRQR